MLMLALEVSCFLGTNFEVFVEIKTLKELCRVEKLGYDVPTFDFRVNAVTSMSADIHKYGFGLKVSCIPYPSGLLYD